MPNQATDHLTDLETQLEDLQKQPPQNPVFSLDEFTEVDVGEYAYEEEEYETTISTPLDVGPSSSSPSPAIVSPHLGAQRTRRLSSDAGGVEPIEPFPRIQWSIDASDEMIFHWVCSRRFNEQPLPQQRKSWAVKWNIFYWGAFLVTLLSLWLGREFHIALEQGGPVCAKERRREYEVRVHWIYTTSGAMLWVLVRSGLAIAYHRAVHKKVEWVQLGVSWVLVVCYCTGNAVFLRMMRKRNLVGTRSLIVCNAVFSVCMLAALISYAVDVWAHEVSGDMKTIDAAYQAYVLFEKTCAVAFFLLATGVYCKLWSIYRYQERNIRRRLLETVPAMVTSLLNPSPAPQFCLFEKGDCVSACSSRTHTHKPLSQTRCLSVWFIFSFFSLLSQLSASVMLVLLYLGLVFNQKEFQPYIWATFT